MPEGDGDAERGAAAEHSNSERRDAAGCEHVARHVVLVQRKRLQKRGPVPEQGDGIDEKRSDSNEESHAERAATFAQKRGREQSDGEQSEQQEEKARGDLYDTTNRDPFDAERASADH